MDTTLSKILELSSQRYKSDADFEKDLNVKPKTIFNWKRGTSKTYYQMLPLICSLLSVSSDYLLGLKDENSETVPITGISGINSEKLVANIDSLAKKANMSRNKALIESGAGKDFVTNITQKGQTPAVSKVVQLAKYFGVSVDYLLGLDVELNVKEKLGVCKIPKLFELMKERNITAKKLSDDTKISTGNISDWKSGRSTPSAERIVLLATYFGVSSDYLLGLDTEQKVGGDTSDVANYGKATVECIQQELDRRGIKPATMSKDLGFSNGLFSQWKSGMQNPSAEKIIKIADYLDCSVDYLLGRDKYAESCRKESVSNISELEERMLMAFRSLTPEDRLIEIGRAEGIAEKYTPEQKEKAS